MTSPIAYDKGKYHDETITELGLHEQQASVHTAIFLGWVIESRLFSEAFAKESPGLISAYLSKEKTSVQVYDWWDRCLVDDMLNDEGNAFAQDYFDFETGSYLADYSALLAKGLQTVFHVPYSWEHQERMSARITKRFQQWKRKRARKWWEFWK